MLSSLRLLVPLCGFSSGGHAGRDALGGGAVGGGAGADPGAMPSPPRREAREKELKDALVQLGDANEVRGRGGKDTGRRTYGRQGTEGSPPCSPPVGATTTLT